MTNQDYIIVTYGYKEIYGFDGGGLDRVRKEVTSYNFYNLLETISKISLQLFATGYTNQATQIRLVKDVFADDLDVRKRILAAVKRGKVPRWAIFTEQPLVLLTKVALEKSPKKGGKPVNPVDVQTVGKWLLILSDVCTQSPLNSSLALPLDVEREELRKHLFKNYFFVAEERLLYKIVRFHQLFKLIRHTHPEFDIDKKFSDATGGISLDKYVSFCFYLITHWINLTTRELDITKDWIVCKKNYFRDTKLKKKDINESLSLLLLDVSNYEKNYSETLRTILAGKDEYSLNFLPLQNRPLISHQECFVCPSPKFLLSKATDGIYWILEKYLRESGVKKDWDLLPTAWGDSFEEYNHTRLENSFKNNYHKRIMIGTEEKFDGVIDGNTTIFPIEMKYAHWSIAAKLTGLPEKMLPTLTQLFSSKKGVGQLTRGIKELENGKWNLPFNTKGKKIVPILIVGEAMPMDAYNRKLYENYASAHGSFYENNDVLPFIILNAEDVEIIEAIANKDGADVVEKLLVDYSQLFKRRLPNGGYVREAMEFKNYLVSINYQTESNSSLSKIFGEEIINTATMSAFGQKIA